LTTTIHPWRPTLREPVVAPHQNLATARPAHVVRATVIVPCCNEEGYIDRLLATLLPQLLTDDRWRVVLVDDASTDATAKLLALAAMTHRSRLSIVTGRFGSPGGARSAGVAAAMATATLTPEWLVTVDADVEVSVDWLAQWNATFDAVDDDESVGAVNGGERQDHLYTDHPHAKKVSNAFGLGLTTGERLAGITNLNGVNHAVRSIAYLTAGPYLQPTAPGPDGMISLAGEDWDLGVRLRRAGFRIVETHASVIDRGRRFLADVHAYVSGEAYEGAFKRLKPTGGPRDIPEDEVAALVDGAIERSLRHFFLKPILAGAVPLDAVEGLSASTREAMANWMIRWPHPTFEASRNGFIFGRLERFSNTFVATVRSDLHLQLDTVLALVA
jgi:cellulose synthase/poly-beta-1,6-N-acetylglucosamine synthase-like glycosyltransferase